ncbi:TPA: hypothetical protein ACF3ZC_004475 [Vibrio parahaemolyticus]
MRVIPGDFQVLKELDSGDVLVSARPRTFRCYCVSLKTWLPHAEVLAPD